MGEFDRGEGSVGVDRIDDESVGRDVFIVSEATLDVRRRLRRGMDLYLFGRDDRPPTFGLDPSHRGERGRVAVAHPVAVRHLEEPVSGRHRSDLDRLEQDVEARLASHEPRLTGAYDAAETEVAHTGVHHSGSVGRSVGGQRAGRARHVRFEGFATLSRSTLLRPKESTG
jgi:hypothetical protein